MLHQTFETKQLLQNFLLVMSEIIKWKSAQFSNISATTKWIQLYNFIYFAHNFDKRAHHQQQQQQNNFLFLQNNVAQTGWH